ncbi:MAG: nucleotide disphospho-sugar-binding domain-containing protein [Bacteroidota bacterium]
MKTILIYTSPARGHLYPMMDVALELRQQRYDVIVQTLAGEKERVTDAGLKHLAISPEIEAAPLHDYEENNPVSQFRSAFTTWLSRTPHEIEDLQESYHRIHPDLLIVDVNTWGAAAFAEAQGKPWMMFMPYCLPISSADTPAFGPGFAPPRNALHRLRDRVVDSIINRAVRSQVKELNRIRTTMGVAVVDKFEDIFDRPDIVLYRTAEPFDYPRKNWPANILPIGPGLWSPPAEEAAWIDALPSPRILISVSTEKQDDGAIIETALRCMAEEDASLIVTTAALDPEQFKAPHDRVRITRFLSHAQIIDKFDLVVTHGGMGSTQRALAAGVPVCVIPCGRDQSETARRVEVSGSGTMLPKSKLNEQRLKQAMTEAMQRRAGAKRISDAFANAGGAKRAVRAISDLLA